MKFQVRKEFDLTPDEAQVVANEFIEWLNGEQGWLIQPTSTSDNRSFSEMAFDWVRSREETQ